MKAAKFLYYGLALLLLLNTPLSAYAEDDCRNIYIGDIITLNIASAEYSVEDIREYFGGFEIVELEEVSGTYRLSLRTFMPGEYSIPVGDKNIVITVAYTLDDIERADVFPGGTEIIEAGFYLPAKILGIIAAGMIVLLAALFLLKPLLQKKAKAPEPYQLFLKRAGALSAEHDNYFVDLTLYFKEYIEVIHSCRIRGKTSTEIIAELEDIPSLANLLADIKDWLHHCDRLKFTGLIASAEQKQHHYTKLLALVERIDLQRTEEQKEDYR